MKLKGKIATGEIWVDGQKLSPEHSQAVINHSPTGFSWGYGGSGPAQLALALMLEYFPKDKALAIYQDFKWEFIATLPQEDFETTIDLEEWKKSLVRRDQNYDTGEKPLGGL